ncbi:vWA domain-containing protein [Mariniblastus fucicola]|uniref:VWFA domain-containing protein n=1 Tax=Mariniblastus fucicola TaxID=980251 RepID=A0A5B9P1D8_9BACT|nr:vWA domain-containing protein [Mariniblastus fucicola]QEG20337.1 hypothetical protein MFFC18_01840 [Mariniblastus fucicola]
MNQPGPGKLETIVPSLRKPTLIAPRANAPKPGSSNAAGTGFSISTDRSPLEPAGQAINISHDRELKAGAAVFSAQNLMAMLPGWSVSFAGHAVALVLLALIATSPLRDEAVLRLDGMMVDASQTPVIEDIFSELEVTDVNLLKVDVAALNSEASEDTAEIVHEDGFDVSLMEGMSDGIGLEAMAQTGLTPLPKKDDEGIEGKTNGGSTRFFGTEAIGTRFVFIIDASDSMNEGFRWMQACRELEKSIAKLGKDQQAMVLLYNFQTFPMFDTPPDELKMLPVTKEFKTSLSEWLRTQVPIGGTRPAHALSYSLTLKPDAIFLLSDGQLADNSIQVLAKQNKASRSAGIDKVPIHTVSLGPNELGAELMQFIAKHNDGKFTWVQ